MLATALNPVQIALLALGLYIILGLIFAIPFITRGAPALDPALKSSPPHVRLLFIPGSVALWPLLAAKWLTARSAKQ